MTLVGLITISLSVYMITYSHTLYGRLEPVLGVFERRVPYREENFEQQMETHQPYDVILFGLGRYGKAIAKYLQKEDFHILAVDFNPDEVSEWSSKGHNDTYGDACDLAFVGSLPLNGVKWVISAMPQHELGLTHEDPRLVLIEGLKQQQYEGGIAVSIHQIQDRKALEEKGVSLFFMPFHDAAEQAVARIKEKMA